MFCSVVLGHPEKRNSAFWAKLHSIIGLIFSCAETSSIKEHSIRPQYCYVLFCHAAIPNKNNISMLGTITEQSVFLVVLGHPE